MGRRRLADKVASQIRLEPVDFAKLKQIASLESRSMNAQLEYFVRQGIIRYESEHGLIEVSDEMLTDG